MGSPWTDESAIVRDLSFAQGRWVPGGIDAAVAGGKPPIHNVTEETEEEYFKHWTADGDFSTGPDLYLIKQMLELVHEEEPDIEDTPPGPVEIIKLNPATPVLVPKLKKTAKKIEQKPEKKKIPSTIPKKPLRKRNVAIESLIAISEKLAEDIKEVPIKLSKPEDFIKAEEKPEIDSDEVEALNRKTDSLNKVNSWLLSQDLTCMFKKKSVNENENSEKQLDSDDRSSLRKKSPVRSPVSSVKTQNGKQYVPSSWAGEYYKKCVERSHMQQLVQEDIWVRAENLMKQIDEQKAEELRKQEEEDAALAAQIAEDLVANSEDPQDSEPEKLRGIANWMLPQHRHLLTADCTVCKVLAKGTSQIAEEEVIKTNHADNEEIQAKLEQVIEPAINLIELEPGANEEALFRLVRSSLVEDLTELGEPQKEYVTSEGSSEELNVFA